MLWHGAAAPWQLAGRLGTSIKLKAVVVLALPWARSAFYAVLVHRLAIYAPRFLPTLGHPHAVALHFAHRDQLVAGLALAAKTKVSIDNLRQFATGVLPGHLEQAMAFDF